VADTSGIDWIEILLQLGTAIVLVGIVGGLYGSRRVH